MATLQFSIINRTDSSAGLDMSTFDLRYAITFPNDFYYPGGDTWYTRVAGDWIDGETTNVDGYDLRRNEYGEDLTGGWIVNLKYHYHVLYEDGAGSIPDLVWGFDFHGLSDLTVRHIYELPQQQLLKRVLDGNDRVTGSNGNDLVYGYKGHDRLDGGNGADLLDGGAGNDWLAGRNGDDTLKGRDGNDTLIGGRGRDVHYGGEGQDTFVFNSIRDSVLGSRRDVIQDFQTGIDKLDLSRIDANGDPSDGDQSLVWIGSSNFTYAGQVRFADGILEINTNDNLHADFQLRIKTTIDEADLIV